MVILLLKIIISCSSVQITHSYKQNKVKTVSKISTFQELSVIMKLKIGNCFCLCRCIGKGSTSACSHKAFCQLSENNEKDFHAVYNTLHKYNVFCLSVAVDVIY